MCGGVGGPSKTKHDKTNKDKARQVKKKGEGFAIFVALILFNVDGEGWVVCGGVGGQARQNTTRQIKTKQDKTR
jgi:hypothetical protein